MSELEKLPATTAAPKERVAYLDNARYWVILLVVIGHSLTMFKDMDSARAIYVWIYAFHMPFFILISGYTARRYKGDLRQIKRIISTLVIPYLLTETALQLITRHYEGTPNPLKILSPQWLAWFLAALFVWRLSTPIWRALKYPITTSIIISLLVGLIEVPNVLALPKILGFLPFYVIGLHMNRERFIYLSQTWVRIVAALILGTTFIISYLYSQNWTVDWLLWNRRYDESPLNASPWEGISQRALLLVIGIVMVYAALALVPRRRSWITVFGGRTFYCYLLHGYIIIILRVKFHFFDEISKYGVVAVICCIIGAVMLGNILMMKIFSRIFRPFFEPRLDWMFRGPAPAPAPATDQASVPVPGGANSTEAPVEDNAMGTRPPP